MRCAGLPPRAFTVPANLSTQKTYRAPRMQEMRRRQLAEAAEKRQMESASRGIKNPSSVEQKKRKQEEMEKRLESSGPGPEGGGLRWQVG
ncbi:small VCP/p97-interacting protein isoform X1 [Varanus komodoensis]|uniref:small VCP/p97-interacting protein isoform X1 n=1 Tax=Varanus komodoensis TaxID=61221 RepID=UPI001CF7955A|nr:small VCP/p97-interacting protein isoform X1 [Varanus komodoensis]